MINKYACPFCNKEFEWDDEKQEDIVICASCGKKMSAPKPAFSKGERIGGYIINKRIGLGGMGEVYTAEQISMQRTVALKILQEDLSSDKNYLERFLREVRTLAQIEHPNIVRAIEAGADNGRYFFSMTFVKGKDIKRLLDEGKKFSEEGGLKICLDVAKALKYVWDKHKLLHRDIKPANIMLTDEGEVKLMDLGISKKVAGDDAELTMAGVMVGSPQYISPEQAKAQKDIDFRSDMYSLGASLFHILTGRTPYQGESGMTIVAHHLSSPVPDPRQINPKISKRTAAMIMKMMAKQKEERYSSWDQLIDEISSIIDSLHYTEENKIQESTKKTHENKKKTLIFHNPVLTTIFLIVFITTILSLYYIVRKSIIEAREKKAEALYKQALLFYQKNPEPENFKHAIVLFEKAKNAGSPKIKFLAQEEINKITQRVKEIKITERKALISAALEELKKKSYEYEQAKNYDSAIKLWEAYKKNGQFAEELKTEISRALDYLQRKKSEEENE